ncbi:efflux transporter outer membrane subunit [Arachidicoccus ginsenosidivorans]|jgi:NodT family efflux transporter outer membrane factor (OMF) lipoprotein|uniref:Efflux transporter outer membrane subunit n=1 Tax=Arachidicoccus ginsenosidivorans TaxID=496057 RepID=A0A5B8VNW3_9BACT|nr:efflux transporter outer membrane subunit [Arachidicoccus ginsenosidivorans]QEC71938.1 efflux transporter outer membrane subunit [Arachidicoccus ginsenosidivorans]
MLKINNSKNIVIAVLLILTSTLLMQACKVTEDYKRPDFKMPNAYKLPDSLVERSFEAIPSWKDYFKDSTLLNILDSAVANNLDLRDAIKNIQITDQLYKQSKSLYAPDIDLNLLNVTREFRSHDYYSSPSSGWYDRQGKTAPKDLYLYQSHFANTVAVDWEIDIWGKIKREKEEARSHYLETFEAKKAVQTALVADVADAYYNLIMLDEQLQVATRNYHLRSNTLKMVELQYKSAEVTALAVQQTKNQVLEAQALIPQLKKEIAVQENALKMLTGNISLNVGHRSALSEIPADSLYREIPLYYVQNRPDVLSAEYDLMAANASVGVHQANRFPNLTITFEGGMDAMLPKNWFNIPGALLGGFFGGLTQPVFHKRKLKTEYEVAKLKRDQSEIAFQKAVYSGITEVRNALVAVRQLSEQLSIAKQQVAVSQKAVHSAAMLFTAGFATYLEVITAQSNELDTELHLASLKADLMSARIQLYRALGGGWK